METLFREWLATCKMALLTLMLVYHYFCGVWLFDFKHDRNKHSHVYYRWMNEVPVLFWLALSFWR